MTKDTPAETFLTVCDNIAAGDTVAQACKAAKVAERTFFRALAADGEGNIGQSYARARRFRADKRAAEIEDLARRACLPRDNAEHLDPNAARVAIDSLKWLAARENNTRYGERLAVDTSAQSMPQLSRAESVAALREGSITIDDLMQRWTKPAQPLEALLSTDQSADTNSDVLDVDV